MALTRSKITRSSLRRAGVDTDATEPPIVASWVQPLVRYFFVSYDTGLDTNTGYIDAAAGTVFAAGVGDAAAVKTFTRLMQIVPLLGNGRAMVVLIKNRAAGATYLDADGVTQSSVDWSALSGYKLILRRGSTDLTNSSTDKQKAGFVTALAGPNSDGSFTCLAGGTSTTLSVTGTPFTAEPGIIGLRVRFTGNVTAALANVVTNVSINTTSAITFGTAVGVNVAGDTFFLEKPGVSVAQWIDNASGETIADPILGGAPEGLPAIRDIGIMVKSALRGSLQFSGAPRWVSGCAQDSATAGQILRVSDCAFITATSFYFDEANGGHTVGFSLRAVCTIPIFERINEFVNDSFAHAAAGGAAVFDRILSGNYLMAGSYLGSPTTFSTIGGPAPGAARATLIGGGSAATTNKLRSVGGFTLSSVSASFRGIDFASAGNAITFSTFGQNGGSIMFDNLTGTVTSNGINCASAMGTIFIVGSIAACTVAGASNEIVCDVASVTYAGLALTNVIDRNGNEFIGSAGRIIGTSQRFTGSNAFVVGDIIRSTGTSGQGGGAEGDTLADSTVIGVAITSGSNGNTGYLCPPGGGTPYTLFTAAPTAGAIAYLSTTVVRQATTVEPVITGVLQKVKLGRVHRVVGSHAQITFLPDVKPENFYEEQPIGVQVSNAAAAFSATQTWLIATGTYTADRAFTLEAISTLGTNKRRMISDLTTGGAFNIVITPNAADSIDGAAAGVTLSIPCGSKQTITLRATPSAGWKIV